MKVFVRISLVCSLLAVTSSCGVLFGDNGVFRGRSKDYLRTGAIKTIDVPRDMQVTSLEELYVVPDVNVRDEFGDPLALGDYEIPRPRPYSTDKSGVAVKIQSQLGKRWVFLNASTSQVWPQTQSFLSENGILVNFSDASQGVIETGWMQFKADLDNQSRFRIKIDKGIHPNTTEVHVVQVQLPMGEQPAGDFVWPEESDNADREKYLVDQLAQALAANVDNKAASLMGQNVGGEERVSYTSVNQEPQLRIRLPWQRAYASLSESLKTENFQFWEQDGDRKVFYVNYLTDEQREEKGFLSKLAFWSNDDDTPTEEGDAEAPAKLDALMQNLHDSPKVRSVFEGLPNVAFSGAASNMSGYLIVVQTFEEQGEEVQGVIVRDAQGRTVPSSLSKDLLRVVRSNLI